MRFGVLGPLEVWTEEGATVPVPGHKVRALLAYLLVRPGGSVLADRLIDDLWGPDVPANPSAALQAKVSQLRRALEDAETGGRELVVSTSSGYRLGVAADSVDAGRFAALVTDARAQGDLATRARTLGEALALWRGTPFADFVYQPFVRAAIDELTEQWLAAREEQAEARLELGEHQALVAELGRLLEEHPLRERLYAVQMRALYRCGRQAEALQTYTCLRTRLADDLGLDPSTELTELQRAILTHDAQLEPELAPSLGVEMRTNVPEAITALVGREPAVAEISAMLDTARLVTLTGLGGVGKTRLALEVARRRCAAYVPRSAGEAWVVDLTGFDPSLHSDTVGALTDLVGSTLGVRDDAAATTVAAGAPGAPANRLARALESRRLLLVLDNCEHAVDPAATLTETLLGSVTGLRVLATSREPLGVPGENIWPVPPLALPYADGSAVGVDALARSSAVQLFVARAAETIPGFELTADNGDAIATICRQLDGLPLALELAVTRVRTLGVHDLAVRLKDRFELLANGHRNAPARQQTLRAMIDWSWELLTGAERAVLRRLVVHSGGCMLESAEQICSDEDVDTSTVPSVLARLVDRSLVAVDDTADGRRYRLLETVAAYCRERLAEAGEVERVQTRHAQYYAKIAQHADRLLRGSDQRQWLERLDHETANLRTALTTTVHRGDAALALRLAVAPTWYWFLRGTYHKAHRLLDLALSVSGDAPAIARADALAWRSAFASLTGAEPDPLRQGRSISAVYDDLEDQAALARTQWILGFINGVSERSSAERLIDQLLQTFLDLDDRWGVAAALYAKADQALQRGDLDAANEHAEEAAELFADLGDRWGQAQTCKVLGVLAEIAGDHERSAQLQQEAFEKAEELGLWPTASEQLSRLGRLALLAGDYSTADDYHHRALRLARAHSHEGGVSFARGGLALSARRQGHLDEADAYLRPALEWERHIDYQVGQAWVLAQLGFGAEQRGDTDSARELHLDGLTAARSVGDPRAVALALEGLAGAQAVADEYQHAAALLAAAADRRASVGSPLPPAERVDLDRIVGAVRAHLDDVDWDAASRRGQTESLDELVAPLAPSERVDQWP